MIILNNLQFINGEIKSLKINKGKIESISSNEISAGSSGVLSMHFNNAMTFPGLINSHDHLEFNLLPQLANNIYRNYLDWATDVHQKNKDIISSILKIPKHLRVAWGIYKNLLNGVTTVVQHGAYYEFENSLINIFQDSYSLHSVGLEKKWRYKLNRPFVKDKPYVIHTGEGTDNTAFKEIDELLKWNLFKRRLIAIHGVAMNAEQAKSFEALVWCPDSNLFLLNATAKVNELKKNTEILFGTDSTLSANWNIWEQVRLAKKMNMLSDKEIFHALTSVPSTVWGLNDRGVLEAGRNADIIVAKMKDRISYMNSFFELNPEDILLIVRNGRIILFDEIYYMQLSNDAGRNKFCKVFINNACKYVDGNLKALIKEIRKYSADVKFPIEVEED